MNYKKRLPIILGSVAVAMFVGLGTFAIYQYNQARLYERHLSYGYLRSLQQLTDSMHSVAVDLEKASYTGTSAGLSEVSARLWRESGTAKTALSALPLGQSHLEDTNLFLSQVGDYAMSLSRAAARGEPPTPAQQQELTELVDYAKSLTDSVDLLENGVSSGEIPLHYVALGYLRENDGDTMTISENADIPAAAQGEEQVDTEEDTHPTGTAHEQLYTAMEEGFAGYPRLIYDGPFSTHLDDQNPAMLENMSHVSMEQARGRASSVLGVSLGGLSFDGDEHSALEAYRFSSGDGQTIALTKQGGLISYYQHDREVEGQTISLTTAKDVAQTALAGMGFYNMDSSYYEVSGGVVIYNFAHMEGDITCYTDLIKVGGALDTGEVVRVDARGYLMNHTDRLLPAPSVSVAQAQENVSSVLSVTSHALALIPSPGMEELLCYEFSCTGTDGREVLVYINAVTGHQEQILLLEIGENGKLTV